MQSVLWRIRIVIPAFGRAGEVSALLQDLAREAAQTAERCRLSVLVVDNASEPPLEQAISPPQGLNLDFLRLDDNRGGAGGFNAGLGHWLSRGVPGDACELLWLLDSDVRLTERTLPPLLHALENDPGLGIVGSALVSPVGGEVFELGGRIDPRTGEFTQELPPAWDRSPTIPAEYIAACSMLIRRGILERAGLMADVFLNGDDVEWVYRATRVTGCRAAIATASRVVHPRPNRPRTIARYYAARNAFRAIDEAARPRPGRPGFSAARARSRRAHRELARALSLTMVGRQDLGELHLRGLEDAAACRESGPGEGLAFDRGRDLSELPDALREALPASRGRVLIRPGVLTEPAPVMRTLNSLCVEPVVRDAEESGWFSAAAAAARRLIAGPENAIAIVPCRGFPQDWLIARVIVTVADGRFVVSRWSRAAMMRSLMSGASRGLRAARRLKRRRSGPDAPQPIRPAPVPTVSVVILSYNRWERLRETLGALRRDPALAASQIIIADNASTDGTPEKLRAEFPHVELVALDQNKGVAAFNEGVQRATGDVLLILDDDAWPAPGSVDAALQVLARRADIGAVTLNPHHPETGIGEWPFAHKAPDGAERWPVMGCANLVRRSAWDIVGGYEESFFLYRNDTDLALKLLSAGYRVYFDPSWHALHNSPAAAAKSFRWFELATRNWIWMCRRHGRGLDRTAGIILGWLWAHKLAGASPSRHWATIRGVCKGLCSAVPKVQVAGLDSASPLRQLLRLRLSRRV